MYLNGFYYVHFSHPDAPLHWFLVCERMLGKMHVRTDSRKAIHGQEDGGEDGGGDGGGGCREGYEETVLRLLLGFRPVLLRYVVRCSSNSAFKNQGLI